MAAQLKVFYTTAARLNQLEVRNGQLIFVKDARRIYLDMNGVRIGYDSTVIFETDDERAAYENPQEGFYFVLDTNSMWLFKNEWIPINNESRDVIFFGDVDSFPQQGNKDVLYVDGDAIYRYDDYLSEYSAVSTRQEWGKL